MTVLDRLDIPAEVVEIAATLEDAGFETWCVGGAIRDALLGGNRDDVDLATAARPEQVQGLFRRTVPVGLKFGTVGVFDRRNHLHEVTTFRRDVTTDGRHAVVEYGVSLEADLARRDFTINAIAYHPIRHDWRDPFGGAADLDLRVVRAVGLASERFQEDYLRILRAIRFAGRLGFEIDPAGPVTPAAASEFLHSEHAATGNTVLLSPAWAAAKVAAAGLERLSAERVRDEWFRSLESARVLPPLFDRWREVGAAERWLPGLPAEYPFAEPSPPVRDPVLLTAVGCRDGGPVLARLKAPTVAIDRAERIARGPAAPESAGAVATRRWLAAVGPAADDLMAAHRLRHGAEAPWQVVAAGIRERGEATSRGELAVTGTDLKDAGIGPGPAIGRVLGELLAAVLEDPSQNRRDLLLARVRRP